MLGPIIVGDRVRLVPPTEDMLPIFCSWFADTEVTKFLNIRFPPSLSAEKEWFDRVSRSNEDVLWAVTLEDKLIGTTGIHQIDWRNRHAITGNLIGDKSEWGKGYASEVVALRTRFAFESLGLEKLKSQVFSGNLASRRVLEKAGYRLCGTFRREAFIDGHWYDSWLFEILREEWLQTQSME